MKYIFKAEQRIINADSLQQAKDVMKGLEERHTLNWDVKPWYPTIQEQVGEFVEGMGEYKKAKEKEKSYIKEGQNLFRRDLRVEKKR